MMIDKGTLRENFQTRACLGKKAMRRGHAKGKREKVVIDVDNDSLDDVIIIDVTESLQKKLCGSNVLRKNRKYPFPSVISIDDDDIDHMGDGGLAGSSREIDDNAGGSKSPASDHFMNSMCLDGDECYVINEKKSAFKFSKCGQTNSTKASGRNCYGLGFNCESDSSENDCSDCELMEGSFEVLREQWEKASVKKKKQQLFNDQSAFDVKVSASGSCSHMNLNVGIDRKMEHSVSPGTSGSSYRHYQERNMFTHSPVGDSQMDNHAFDVGKHRKEPTQNVTGSGKQKLCVDKDPDYQHADQIFREGFPTSSRWKNHDRINGVSSCSKSQPEIFYYMKVNQEESRTVKSRNYKFTLRPSSYKFSHVPFGHNPFDEAPINDDSSISLSQPTCGLKSSYRADLDGCDGPSCNTLPSGKSVDESSCSQVELDSNTEETSLPDTLCNETKDNRHETCLAEGKEQLEVRGELCTQDSGASSSGQGDIINQRERLKESDAYKQAMEEEWASRHRQLVLQQEEAQRLRKRKQAESMRALDMERRQKQRVEEVRETKMKDEENINLKEQFRAEIRKEMSKLESISINMGSLLRDLGIQVEGGVNPPSHEVHAAYKRALLKFHPDRASKTDIRQQVEAEEKFKLISRMKEKFMSTSRY